jgi:hypothetical protein
MGKIKLKFDKNTLYDDFPISEYYKGNVKGATTIKRGGNWWSAVLLIEEPKSEKNIIMFYKWQKTEDGWKVRQRFKINSKLELEKINETLENFKPNIS